MKPSKWASELHWVREGKQDRSRETQLALLDAAEMLFAERGIFGATLADISEAAGCSIGAFYHHYRDKQSVQIALFDRYEAEYKETIRLGSDPDLFEGATIGDILLAGLQGAALRNRDLPSRLLAGLELARANPEMSSRLDALRSASDSAMLDLLLARRDEIGHPDPELALTFVIEQLETSLRARFSAQGEKFRFGVTSDEDFARETLRSISAYLQTELPTDL